MPHDNSLKLALLNSRYLTETTKQQSGICSAVSHNMTTVMITITSNNRLPTFQTTFLSDSRPLDYQAVYPPSYESGYRFSQDLK